MSGPFRPASSSSVERKNGVRALFVRWCSSTRTAACLALHRSTTTVVPPAESGRSSPRREAMWPAGNVTKVRVLRSAGTVVMPARRVSWLCRTPFGAAVEPDV